MLEKIRLILKVQISKKPNLMKEDILNVINYTLFCFSDSQEEIQSSGD